ncbi:hypothetical protein V8C42DRAFT_218361 [Trichoderma barbatum]
MLAIPLLPPLLPFFFFSFSLLFILIKSHSFSPRIKSRRLREKACFSCFASCHYFQGLRSAASQLARECLGFTHGCATATNRMCFYLLAQLRSILRNFCFSLSQLSKIMFLMLYILSIISGTCPWAYSRLPLLA